MYLIVSIYDFLSPAIRKNIYIFFILFFSFRILCVDFLYLEYLMTPEMSFKPITPKSDDYGTLGFEILSRFNSSNKKGYELKYEMYHNNLTLLKHNTLFSFMESIQEITSTT